MRNEVRKVILKEFNELFKEVLDKYGEGCEFENLVENFLDSLNIYDEELVEFLEIDLGIDDRKFNKIKDTISAKSVNDFLVKYQQRLAHEYIYKHFNRG